MIEWSLVQNNEEKLVAEMHRIHLPFQFYHEISHDGKLGKLRWSNLYIHQLDIVLHSFVIADVLDSEYDKRKTKIDNLTKKQMIEECDKLQIDNTGKKVFPFPLIILLFY